MKNKLVLFTFLLLTLLTVKCYSQDEQPYLNSEGTLADKFQIGKDAGYIKWDRDSLAYKLVFVTADGSLDSAWIAISNGLSTPWAIRLEAEQRADVDGNLLSQINLLASIIEADSVSIEYALAQLSLKANKTYVDSTKINLEAQINLLAAAVESDSASIDYAMSQINLKANKTYVDGTKDSLGALIDLRATVGSIDTVKNRLDYAEGQISAKANITKVDSVQTQIMSEVFLRARASYVDTIKTAQDSLIERVSIAEAGVTAHASQIANLTGDVSNIESSLLLYALRDSIISYINISPQEIKIAANRITLDGTTVANTLLGKTIIAPIIRTSSGGSGIVLNGTTGRLEFLNEFGEVGSYLDADGGNIKFSGTLDGGYATDINTGSVTATNLYSEMLLQVAHGSARMMVTPTEIYQEGNLGDGWVRGATYASQEWTKSLLDDSLSNYVKAEYYGAMNIRVTALESYPFSSYLTVEADPNVPDWAKAASKPSYTYSEVGAQPAGSYLTTETDPNVGSHIKAITSQNITDWNWASGVVDALNNVAISGSYNDLNSVPSSFTPASHGNEAHSSTFLVTETDPTIYAWAKAATKPTYTYSEVGAQPAGSYLTTETDPNVPSYVKSITSQNITDWNWASGVVDALNNVAISGSYNDLINKPTLFSGSYTDLTNKPSLFSGSYTDLTNKPTIPSVSFGSTSVTAQDIGGVTYLVSKVTITIGATSYTVIYNIEEP